MNSFFKENHFKILIISAYPLTLKIVTTWSHIRFLYFEDLLKIDVLWIKLKKNKLLVGNSLSVLNVYDW